MAQRGLSDAARRHAPRLGIHPPPIVQSGTWPRAVLRFECGTPLWTGRPVIEELLVRLPLFLDLARPATVVWVIETSLAPSARSRGPGS